MMTLLVNITTSARVDAACSINAARIICGVLPNPPKAKSAPSVANA